MNLIENWAATVSAASNYNSLTAAGVIFIIYTALNIIESWIEKLVFGKRFFHTFDIVIGATFLYFYFRVIAHCARLGS